MLRVHSFVDTPRGLVQLNGSLAKGARPSFQLMHGAVLASQYPTEGDSQAINAFKTAFKTAV